MPQIKFKAPTLGFSLIELMIVLTVIASLSTIATTSYLNYVKRSKVSEGQVYATHYIKLSSDYFYTTGNFPNSLAQLGESSQQRQSRYVTKICLQNGGAFQAICGGDPVEGALQYVPSVSHNGTLEWSCYGINISPEYLPKQCQGRQMLFNGNGLLVLGNGSNGAKLAYSYPCPEYAALTTAAQIVNSNNNFVQNIYDYMLNRGYSNDQIAHTVQSYSSFLQNMQISDYVASPNNNPYQVLNCGQGYSAGYTFGYMIEMGSVAGSGICPPSAPIIWNCQRNTSGGAFEVAPQSKWTCGPATP